jgi:dolichyl-phosphate-mannose--protein O-mannosyl transferase
MIPEAIIAMLATVRLGAVHSVVFGGMFCFNCFTVYKVSEQFRILADVTRNFLVFMCCAVYQMSLCTSRHYARISHS